MRASRHFRPSLAMFHEPALSFTMDEHNEIALNMGPIDTFRAETVMQFIRGVTSFDDWDSVFVDGIYRMGDIERVMEIFNNAADRFFEVAGR